MTGPNGEQELVKTMMIVLKDSFFDDFQHFIIDPMLAFVTKGILIKEVKDVRIPIVIGDQGQTFDLNFNFSNIRLPILHIDDQEEFNVV